MSFSISTFEHVPDAVQALGRIEDFQQLLLLFDGKLQVGGDGVGQLCRVVVAHRGDHGFVIQRLTELDVLLEQTRHALHAGFNLWCLLSRILRGAYGGLKVTISIHYLEDLATLQTLHQDLDVAVRKLQTLDDVDQRTDLKNLIGLGLVDTRVVLGGKEYLLIASQRFFQCAHARLPADHEWRHHVGKDDDVSNRHHGEFLGLEFLALGHYYHLIVFRGLEPLCGRKLSRFRHARRRAATSGKPKLTLG